METVIETRNLTKRYGQSYAVKDLNLNINKGEVFGFLGPNGAGKTTTIAMLTGVLKPTNGDVRLFGSTFGSDYFGLKKRIGVVPEYQGIYGGMSAYEYLSFFSDLYVVKNKNKRIDELLKLFDLAEYKDKLLKKFSNGMKQKISISRALLHDPDILFLDEPIQGLDPMGVKEVRDIIILEKEKGKTIFISSHILSELEKICDVVGIINEGELITQGDMDRLRRIAAGGVELEVELDGIVDTVVASLTRFDFVDGIEVEENTLRIKTHGDKDHRREISKCIFEGGSIILGMKEDKPDLESTFVEITKGKIELLK